MAVTTIAIVDDHRVVTTSLKMYLESFEDLRVVGVAASGEELLERLAVWRPQIVLQDLLIPGGIDGIETTRRVLQRAPDVRVIALTASFDEARMVGVLRAGARGYVRKDADPEVLLTAIRAVARGRTSLDPSAAAQLATAGAGDDFTARELEVLHELALGQSNKEIAATLGIGDETVNTHVGHLFAKLQVENRGQAIVQALKRGIVALDNLQ